MDTFLHDSTAIKSGADNLTTFAKQTLMQQLRELTRNPPENVSVGLRNDKLSEWDVTIMGPEGSMYEGGIFRAVLLFPADFPNKPPVMRFERPCPFHPNVYPDGTVCISILHPPGEDRFNEQESSAERWRPILGVDAIILSVISMLTDTSVNLDSPANIDAARLYKNDPAAYKREVKRSARLSAEASLG